ncbi:MAG: ABC transporter ATP-binding protein [bacterium]|nr:ABC transporter ATP-binding protein [bacterium]
MNEYAVQLKDVVKCYKDGEQDFTVLNKVSLNVKQGEFVAIVGPSGSGKSTLLSIMGVLLSPDQGSIQIGETVVSEKKQKEWTNIRREQIGFIFQNHQLLPFLTVEEQLKLVQDMSKTKEKISPMQMLESLGLGDLSKKYPSKMSGGQKQRVAIARAFMNDPQVILADEPTASLDGERGRQVVELIRQETKKRNKAAIMVTHDERVLELVDTIYRLENGTLVREK